MSALEHRCEHRCGERQTSPHFCVSAANVLLGKRVFAASVLLNSHDNAKDRHSMQRIPTPARSQALIESLRAAAALFACVHELVLIDTLGIHLVDATRAARCSSTRGCGQPTCCGSFQTAQSFTSGRSRHRWGQPNNPPHGKVDSTRQNKHRWTAEIASREKCRRGSMMAGSGSWRACGIA